MKHNAEVSTRDALMDSELDDVSGGAENLDPVAAWYRALGRLGIQLPNQGNPVTDSLWCQTV